MGYVWLLQLAVDAGLGYVLVALTGSSCLGGLCLMMQRSRLEMLMLEKASNADRALAWFFCRAERIMYLQIKCIEGQPGSVAPGRLVWMEGPSQASLRPLKTTVFLL